MDEIAFIDLEASGLGASSWPIEVGWCMAKGAAEARLIKPAPDWPLDAWDDNAETLHGISIDELARRGDRVEDVCIRLNDALKGLRVYSDAPDWDGFWLFRLFSAADMPQEFSLIDFGKIFSGMARRDIDALIAIAAKTAPHRHRAREDVMHMRTVFELVRARD